MRILDVPYINITDMKKSPRSAFEKAEEFNSIVHVLRNNKPYGVVMKPDQYEAMYNEIESLQDRLEEYIIKERLVESKIKTHNEKEVLDNRLDQVTIDENDGWK